MSGHDAREASATPAATVADRLRITEIFHSIQGEADAVGWRTVFVRLTGCPLRCVWYSAVCVHLDHKRGYNTPESIHKNRKIRQQTPFQRKIWTRNGIINSNLQPA